MESSLLVPNHHPGKPETLVVATTSDLSPLATLYFSTLVAALKPDATFRMETDYICGHSTTVPLQTPNTFALLASCSK